MKAAAILGSTLRDSASLLGDGDGSVSAGEDVAVLRTLGPWPASATPTATRAT